MNTSVKFLRNTSFLGRNGTFQCSGVELFIDGDIVSISPVTSRGESGRAFIEIPIEAAGEVVSKLEAMVAASKNGCTNGT